MIGEARSIENRKIDRAQSNRSTRRFVGLMLKMLEILHYIRLFSSFLTLKGFRFPTKWHDKDNRSEYKNQFSNYT